MKTVIEIMNVSDSGTKIIATASSDNELTISLSGEFGDILFAVHLDNFYGLLSEAITKLGLSESESEDV